MQKFLTRVLLGLTFPLILAACSNPTAPTASTAPGPYADGIDHSWTASIAEGQRLYSALSQGLKAQNFSVGLSITASNGWGPIEVNTSNGETAAGDGHPLTLKGKTYSTGLGVHADSEIHVRATGLVTPACTHFKADIGIDDEVGENGKYSSVVFLVYGDGEKLYDSGLVTGSTPTKSIDVPIGNKSDLRFVVTRGLDQNYYDHADWAGATLECAAVPIASGRIVGWGDNQKGQLNIPADLKDVTAISGGLYHSLALKNDGTVVTWGDNSSGQLNIPAGLTGITAISAGEDHSLALKNDGTVVAWGFNGQGQTNVPAGLTGVKGVAAGAIDSFALKNDGTVVGWGFNVSGNLDIPAGLNNVKAVAAGSIHTLALKNDGTVVGWGSNFAGETTIPTGLTGVTAIAAGNSFSLALKSDGTVVAWGYKDSRTDVPAGLMSVKAISANGSHNLALKNDGTVVAWGFNFNGESTPPASLTGVTAIAAGGLHSLAVIP